MERLNCQLLRRSLSRVYFFQGKSHPISNVQYGAVYASLNAKEIAGIKSSIDALELANYRFKNNGIS